MPCLSSWPGPVAGTQSRKRPRACSCSHTLDVHRLPASTQARWCVDCMAWSNKSKASASLLQSAAAVQGLHLSRCRSACPSSAHQPCASGHTLDLHASCQRSRAGGAGKAHLASSHHVHPAQPPLPQGLGRGGIGEWYAVVVLCRILGPTGNKLAIKHMHAMQGTTLGSLVWGLCRCWWWLSSIIFHPITVLWFAVHEHLIKSWAVSKCRRAGTVKLWLMARV